MVSAGAPDRRLRGGRPGRGPSVVRHTFLVAVVAAGVVGAAVAQMSRKDLVLQGLSNARQARAAVQDAAAARPEEYAGSNGLGSLGAAKPALPSQQALKRMAETPEVRADKVFTSLDTNHDELLGRSEFRQYFRRPGQYDRMDAREVALEDVVHEVQEQAMGFWSAFMNSVAMIFVTELGDKTFFIAAIMAMRNPRITVFMGAYGALAIMTVLSTMIGFALPQLLPRRYTGILAAGLFAVFGYKMLKEAYEMYATGTGKSADQSDELAEAEEELKSKGFHTGGSSLPTTDPEAGEKMRMARMTLLWQAFTLTFFAEWGDRSQIATIAMASHQDPMGVTLGGCIGHGVCTGLAVVGGRLLSAKISERMVLLSGGVLFVIFAFHALLSDS